MSLTMVAACGGGGGALSNHPAGAVSEVRAIDWQNRSYDAEQLGTVTVHAGVADVLLDDEGKASPSGTTPASYSVTPPLFADIDGDGVEDAVMVSVTSPGGTGRFSQVELFTVRDHKVVSLGAIPGGDRGDSGIRAIRLDGRAVLVDRNVLADGEGLCCASQFQTERWIWNGKDMAEDPAARSKPRPIPER